MPTEQTEEFVCFFVFCFLFFVFFCFFVFCFLFFFFELDSKSNMKLGLALYVTASFWL